MRTQIHTAAVPLVLVLAALLGAAAAVRPASQAADLDRFSAGEPATRSSAVSAETALRLADRARALGPAIGVASGAPHAAALVDDRFHGRRFHELTYFDERGRPAAIVRLDPASGQLASVVRLGYRDELARGAMDTAMAVARAREKLAALDLALPAGVASANELMGGALWSVTWPRTVEGIPVDRDGVTVRLWRNGELHSVAINERPLSPPARRISPAEARRHLDGVLARLLPTESRQDAVVGPLELRWVAPNDTFQAELADAPGSALRLAYTAEVRFGGETAAHLRALAVWIDAEDGSLLGGDAIQ